MKRERRNFMLEVLENNQYFVGTRGGILPVHGIQDKAKYEAIRASMAVNGWMGVPLVKMDDDLLTGSHRWAAAKDLELQVPVVEIRDVFTIADEDFDFALTEDLWQLELTRLAYEADSELATLLGLDFSDIHIPL